MKNTKVFWVLLFSIVCLLFMVNESFSQQTAGQLFEKALYEEEANGELEKAIEIYEKILKEFPENRPIAAKAQLHIGICKEKLGLKEAIEAYENVIKKYPEQQNEVAMAREKVKGLAKLLEKRREEQKAIKPNYKKLLETEDPILSADCSPNGKWIVFETLNDSTLSIWVMRRNTTERRLFHESVGPGRGPVRWSTTGDYISFCKYSPITRSSLCIMQVDQENAVKEQEPMIVSGNHYVPSYAWHPIKNRVFYVSWEQKGSTLYLSSKRDVAKMERLKEVQGAFFSPTFSPNGEKVYFASNSISRKQGLDLFYLDLTNKERTLFLEKRIPYNYTKNGELFITRITKQGLPALELISMDNENKIQLTLREDFTGAIYSSIFPEGRSIIIPSKNESARIKKVDLANGQISEISQPRGYYWDPIVSPRGTEIAFGGSGQDGVFLHIHNRKDGTEKVIPYFDIGSSAVWSPDGKYIADISDDEHKIVLLNLKSYSVDTLYYFPKSSLLALNWSPQSEKLVCKVKDEKYKLFIVDRSGNKELIESNNSYISPATWFSDNNRLIYSKNSDENSQIVILSLSDNKRLQIYETEKHIFNPILSQNERMIAFDVREKGDRFGKLHIISTNGGEAKSIGPIEPIVIEKYYWLPNNEELAVMFWHRGVRVNHIHLFNINGTKDINVTRNDSSVKYNFCLTPDGTEVYYWDEFQAGGALWEIDISETIKKLK